MVLSDMQCLLQSKENFDLLTLRQGEQNAAYFRSDRFYKVGGRYYFTTREGAEIGPFSTKSAAMLGLERFVSSIKQTQSQARAKASALYDVDVYN